MSAPIKVDFTGVEDFEALPEAKYRCTILEVTPEQAEGSEFQYLNWVLNVDEPPQFTGRKLWLRTSLAPKARWKLKQVLEGLGYDPETLKGEIELDLSDFPGMSVIATAGTEMYQGSLRNTVVTLETSSLRPPPQRARPQAKGAKKGAAKKGGRKVR